MDECIFCKIAQGKVGSLIFEDGEIAAFRDISPCAPVHILIVPKKHISGLNDDGADARILGRMAAEAARLAKAEGVAEGGYRIVMNCGEDAGQSVQHLHMHLIGGRRFAWPPG